MKLDQAQLVETPRGRFHVRTGGAGMSVVMLHGWPESSYCWMPVAARLPPGLRLIAPDLRGLGDSERTPELAAYAKDALAADILAVLDAMGVEQFHLVGHDWGGVLAQEMALVAPERVRRLCLMNISVINNPRGLRAGQAKARENGNFSAWYQHFQQAPELAEQMIPGNETVWLRYFLRMWSRAPFPEDAFAEYLRCYRIPGTAGTGANYYRAMREDVKRWPGFAARKFTMPALYIYGRHDIFVIPEYLQHLEDAFEQVELHELEAGHFVQEEQPEAVAAYLEAFLLTRQDGAVNR